MSNKSHIPYMIIYGVLLILILWMVILTINQQTSTSSYDQWVCIEEACVQEEPAGELWAQQNCAEVLDEETGQQEILCQVTIQGQTQVLPLTDINLSSITMCTESMCVREVPARNATN